MAIACVRMVDAGERRQDAQGRRRDRLKDLPRDPGASSSGVGPVCGYLSILLEHDDDDLDANSNDSL